MRILFGPSKRQHDDTSLRTLVGHSDCINSVVFSDDSKFLASASYNKTNASSSECWRTFVGHQDCVSGVIFIPSSNELVSTSSDKTLKIWDIESSEYI
ncbi:prolyl oligopeptidase [Pyrenophora seminiperda CCB06]|uniref:Mitochondrial division protein 1 n=1 Tax=Pyrenophora seminiperda CCB06 TaxID=1302712 RepID=A0A3M7MD00_9PLEO|nr:prolyl oligopeptidase [Pyrenophora seminiperda CCB06]